MMDEIMIPVEDRLQEDNPEGFACIMSIAEMEIERDRLYREYVDSIGTPDEKRLLKALGLMDEILDEQIAVAQDDILEESDDGDHWDEWYIDNEIDRMREGWDA